MEIKVSHDDVSTCVDVAIPGLVCKSDQAIDVPIRIRVYGVDSIRFFSSHGDCRASVFINGVGYRWDLSVKIDWTARDRNLVYSGWRLADSHYGYALGLDRGLMEKNRYPSDSARKKMEGILNSFIPLFCLEHSNLFENEAHLQCVRSFTQMSHSLDELRRKAAELDLIRQYVQKTLDGSRERNILRTVELVRASCKLWDNKTERSSISIPSVYNP